MTELLEPSSPQAPVTAAPPVSVVILTKDEESNIADCLRSCAWCDDIHVLDSGSADRTCAIASEMGATVHHHPFKSFGEQRNWAIDNIGTKHDWIFHLDADERFTPELVGEIQQVLQDDPQDAGYYVPHKLMFMGRWLRYAEGGYPIYQMRFFHKQRMRFRDYGHGQREATAGSIGMLRRPYLHFNFSKGLDDWIDKHNRYSALEAHEAFVALSDPRTPAHSLFGNAVERRRFFKASVYPRMPGTWLGRFLWMYVLRLGFLDGKAGLHYCLLMSTYDLFTSLKLAELRRKASGRSEQASLDPVLAPPVLQNGTQRPTATPSSDVKNSADGSVSGGSTFQKEESPWSMKEKIGRVIWMLVQATLFGKSFHNWYGWRRFLLRCFGARVGHNVRIRPTVRIEIPWHLDLAENVAVGDFAILYSLGMIRVGRGVTISQYAHLCAGTHDYTKPQFPLICPPIIIGDDAWIAADAFVGPGVAIGDRAIVGARATVVKGVAADQIVGGNPAKFLKVREMTQSE